MSAAPAQADLFVTRDLSQEVDELLAKLLESRARPAVHELIEKVETALGLHARWDVIGALRRAVERDDLTREQRAHLNDLLRSEDLAAALRGGPPPRNEISSSIDELLRDSQVYRSSDAFRQMIAFMARFKNYSPYNNMLVRVQNPSCSFYATARDWRERFGRHLIEDARPMLILAPMHPVILVYDLDQTAGKPVPEALERFATFEGDWDKKWLDRLVTNLRRHAIHVEFKALSSTLAGFAQVQWGRLEWKRRIVVHRKLDGPSRFGVLCHEAAHILLGHLGGDVDNWWPTRSGVDRATAEIEAEAVAHIVTERFGLYGSSAAYVSGYLKEGPIPPTVSLDTIAKVAGRIQQMADALQPKPKRKAPKTRK